MRSFNCIFFSKDTISAQGFINALGEINVRSIQKHPLADIDKLSEGEPTSIIIIDDSLSEKEAIECAEKIRSIEKYHSIPIIFIYSDLIHKDFILKTEPFSPVGAIPSIIDVEQFKSNVFSFLFTRTEEPTKKAAKPPVINEFERLEKKSLLFDLTTDIVAITDNMWQIKDWNLNFARIVGEKIIKNIKELTIKDIFLFPEAKLETIEKTVLEHGEWIGEAKIIRSDSNDVPIACRFQLIHNSSENTKSVLIIARDITEIKNLKKQLERAQRMESIGALASGAAHDINNLLSPVVLGVSTLRDYVSDVHALKTLSLIETQCKRASDLLRNILGFAKAMPGHKIYMNLKHVLREVAAIVERTFPKNITLKTNIPTNLWTVYADPTQLHQVFLNLVINARDAMPNGGTLEIIAKNIAVDESIVNNFPQAKTGNYVVVSVTDTGVGIPEEIIDKIFEPFFTTKTHEAGTGLGLSTSRGIVEEHGGFITVKSQVGKGSVFEVWLPARPEKEEFKPVEKKVHYKGYGETVLVIDDEIEVLEVTKSILERHGYKAIAVSNGIDAVGEIANKRSLIKAVLCDLDMPQMDGPSTMQALKIYEPGVPIIVMTGLLSPSSEKKLNNIKISGKINKPFTPEELLEIVYKVIHGIPLYEKFT